MTTLATKLQQRKMELLQLDDHPIVDGDYYLSKCVGMKDGSYIIEIHSVQQKRVLLTEDDSLICCDTDFYGHGLTELDFIRMVQDNPWFVGRWARGSESRTRKHTAYLANDKGCPAFVEFKEYMDTRSLENQNQVLDYIAQVDGEK